MRHTNITSLPSATKSLFTSNGSGSLDHHPSSLSHADEEEALRIRRIVQVPGGAYSDIWKAQMSMSGTVMMVALKVLRLTSSCDRLRQREEREKIWTSLQHDNIALFLTMYHQPNGVPVFVSEWYENGTATDFLCRHPDVNPMKIIYEIASGIQYLHERGIIHGDLKGSNVLIDNNGHAKLSDFGLSRFIDSVPGLTTFTLTTLRWCAPELLWSNDGRPTGASDMYSFCSMALELITGNVPYATLKDNATLQKVLGGVSPRFLSAPIQYDVPEGLMVVLDAGWVAEASLRPTATQVKRSIQKLICA